MEEKEGFNESERKLIALAKKSFLPLWTHPNVFRDQDKRGSIVSDGKEIVDLLVIFGDYIILFSDKDCKFPEAKDISIIWQRWVNRSITGSIKQLMGAERWLKNYPERVFKDKACSEPVSFKITEKTKIIRIAVCHSNADICSRYRSGIPFIGFDTSINPPTSKPFWLGKMGEEGKYVHIFDEFSFEAILDKLDTIDDFTKYLEYKENIINKGIQIRADSELDLLANFFKNFNEKTQEHLYTIQKNQVIVPSNEWLSLYDDYGYVQGKKLDNQYNIIDTIINKFSHCIRNKSLVDSSPEGLNNSELALRALAGECRLSRRCMSQAIVDYWLQKRYDYTRRIPSESFQKIHFVFTSPSLKKDESFEDYQERRIDALMRICLIERYTHQDNKPVIGLATNPPCDKQGCEDLIYIPVNLQNVDPEMWNLAKEYVNEYKKNEDYKKRKLQRFSSYEFPFVPKKIGRNDPCPCGSGKKYKKCCGAN